MPRQNIEHHLSVFHAAAGGNLHAQHGLLAFVVNAIVVNEFAATVRLSDGPPGETAGYFDDVLLRVSAIDAQSVQLHQLARVVFVQAARLLGLSS